MKFILILTLILLSSLATAEVRLDLSGYNSEDSMSMSLNGENLGYDGLLFVDPQTIMYKNGGYSSAPDCSYSFEITFNGESLKSSASTNSGSFSWKAEITPSWDAEHPDQFFALRPTNVVKSGSLNAQYSNNKIKVNEYIETLDATYMESINIRPDKLQSLGQGSTPLEDLPKTKKVESSAEPDLSGGSISMNDYYQHQEAGSFSTLPTQTNTETNVVQSTDNSYIDTPSSSADTGKDKTLEGKGFIHLLNVQGLGGWGQIEANVAGDVSTAWKSKVDAKQSNIAFGLSVQGYGITPVQNLEMEAKGSDIPYQRLPPGDVKIDYKTASEIDLSQFLQVASDEKDAFYQKYPSIETSNSPWTWYRINQQAFANYIEEDSSLASQENKQKTPNELFNMNMVFRVFSNK